MNNENKSHVNKPVVCLMGPTASGKSALAMTLASKLPLSIISVDSAQVYRGLDIGTAKPSRAELAQVPHHLIDICDPSESYSAGRFRQDAIKLIDQAHQQQQLPLLVGGTMLYFSVLQRGIAELPEADAAVRADIMALGEQHSWPEMHQRLTKLDPQAASKINPNDQQRIARGLEVYEMTGKTLTELQQTTSTLPYKMVNVAVAPKERSTLHQRIEKRLKSMFINGLVSEVEKLHNRSDLHPDLPALRTVGYRQVLQHLAGDYNADEMQQRALFATRQLAKRQLTWLRRWPHLSWFDTESTQLEEKLKSSIEGCL